MSKPKLVADLPLLRTEQFMQEAEAQFKEHPYPVDVRDVVVLVIDRKDVEIVPRSVPRPGTDEWNDRSYGLGLNNLKVTISPNARVLALASTTTIDGESDLEFNAHRTWSSFPDGLRTKCFACIRTIIGSLGMYPFKRIWALTTPLPWRDESGIEKELPIGVTDE